MDVESGTCHRRGLWRGLPRRPPVGPLRPGGPAGPWFGPRSSGPPFSSTWPLPSDSLKAQFPVCDRKWFSSHLAGPAWGPVGQQTDSFPSLTLCWEHGRRSRILRVVPQDQPSHSVPASRPLPPASSTPGLAVWPGGARQRRCEDLRQGRMVR